MTTAAETEEGGWIDELLRLLLLLLPLLLLKAEELGFRRESRRARRAFFLLSTCKRDTQRRWSCCSITLPCCPAPFPGAGNFFSDVVKAARQGPSL